MLQIKKNNIRAIRGDSIPLVFSVQDKNGVPFIIPPIEDNDNVGIYIGFCIRSGPEDKIVHVNYLDMKASPIALEDENGIIRFDTNGYTKYSTQEIEVFATYVEASNRLYQDPSIITCVNDGTNIKFLTLLENIIKNTKSVVEYKFNIGFYISPNDTRKLDAQTFTYDVVLYIGNKIQNYVEGFPLESVTYKRTLIPTHKFILEDNIND